MDECSTHKVCAKTTVSVHDGQSSSKGGNAVEITEVRIKLMEDSDDRLQAFCSITFDDCFVVRDLKIIEGASGPFVAMPSRKLTSHCPKCGMKNHLRANHCNQCGARLKEDRSGRDQGGGRTKLYADIAHPINSTCREMIQQCVIKEYDDELQRSQRPGYVSRYDDDYDDYLGEIEVEDLKVTEEKRAPAEPVPETPPAREESRGSEIQVQHEESQPRGPHTTPSNKNSPQRSSVENGSNKGKGDFGMGIFE